METQASKAAYFSLLQLSTDSFNQLASYLSKDNCIALGLCCHYLYFMTQSKEFLSSISPNSLRITLNTLIKIDQLNIDLWSSVLNCQRLTLGRCPISDSRGIDYNDNTKENKISILMNKMCNYKWFNVLFERVNDLTIEIGCGILPFIPLESLTSNKYGIPLQLCLFHRERVDTTIDVHEFFAEYGSYKRKNMNNNNNNNRRRIELIELDTNRSFARMADDLGQLDCEFDAFIMSDNLEINCLEQFHDLFHKNLRFLNVGSLFVNNINVLSRLWSVVGDEKLFFSSDIIKSDSNFMDYECSIPNISDYNNGCHTPTSVKCSSSVREMYNWLLECEIDDRRDIKQEMNDFMINGRDEESDFNDYQLSNYFRHDVQDYRSRHREIEMSVKNKIICYYYHKLLLFWFCYLIDNNKLKISKIMNIDDDDIDDDEYKVNIDTLIINSSQPCNAGISELGASTLYSFNRMLDNNNILCFKLLNWQNSIERLEIDLCPMIVTHLEYNNYAFPWKRRVKTMLKNIFTKFDSLNNVVIFLEFPSQTNHEETIFSRKNDIINDDIEHSDVFDDDYNYNNDDDNRDDNDDNDDNINDEYVEEKEKQKEKKTVINDEWILDEDKYQFTTDTVDDWMKAFSDTLNDIILQNDIYDINRFDNLKFTVKVLVGQIDYREVNINAQNQLEKPRLLRLDSKSIVIKDSKKKSVTDLKRSGRQEFSQGVCQDLKNLGDKVKKCLRNPQMMHQCFVYTQSMEIVGGR